MAKKTKRPARGRRKATRVRRLVPLQVQGQIVQRAAEKYKLSPAVLWGVYGAETDHGKDIKRSSAGAVGPFQFLPGTAAEHNYPTNLNTGAVTSLKGFAAQAGAAARYISELRSAHGGNLNAALEAYSGGGYGLKHVKESVGFYPAPPGENVVEESGLDGFLEGKVPFFSTEGAGEKAAEKAVEKPLSLLPDISGLILNGILLAGGAYLVVYGVKVAVSPREGALRPLVPKFGALGDMVGGAAVLDV